MYGCRIISTLLLSLFMVLSNAQERIEFSNRSLSRSFEINEGVFSTVDLTNLGTEKDFNSGRSTEFSFRVNESEITSASFNYRPLGNHNNIAFFLDIFRSVNLPLPLS